MDFIEIVKIDISYIDQLQKIGSETFLEAFADSNTVENMEIYMKDAFSIETLTSEVLNVHSSFYFALEANKVVGYLKVNEGNAQNECKDENALEIERIYVVQELYGKRVGQLLLEKALETARHLHVDYLWLGVWEENPRAIHFYRKHGFVPFDTHIFKLGDDEQTDIMMKLLL